MFYDRFYKLCQDSNVTPTQVARNLDIRQSTVSMWKKQGTTPKYDTTKKLADYFGVSVDYLLGRETDVKYLLDAGKRAHNMGERIQTIRISKGLTRKEVASRCKIAEQIIDDYESGRSSPEFEIMDKIAYALDVPVTAWMGYVFTGRINGRDVYEPSHDIIDVVIDEEKEDQPSIVERIFISLNQLNNAGQQKAVERVEELTEIPKYQRQASPEGTETTPEKKLSENP